MHGWYETPCDGPGLPDCPDPLPEAEPIERMQAGDYQWRGGEGSITDRVQEDQREYPYMQNVNYEAYSRPSTGLVYMQARYYEPETGRFTQWDPQPYQVSDFNTGQNNRWTYCGSDPVNMSDPSGMFGWVGALQILAGVVTVAAGLALIAYGGPAGILPGLSLLCYGIALIFSGLADQVENCTLRNAFNTIAAVFGAAGAAFALGAASFTLASPLALAGAMKAILQVGTIARNFGAILVFGSKFL